MANLLTSPFEGLVAADFQVYDRPCWSNNQFNLKRMRTKERMLQLAAHLPGLPGAAGLELRATSEIPGLWNGRSVQDQWVYLVRSAEAREQLAAVLADQLALAVSVRDPAEHHQHAIVFIRLHHGGVEVGFSLNANAGIDRDNLAAALARNPDAAQPLLAALPEAFTLDEVAPGPGFREAFAALVAGQRGELRISCQVDRATVEAAGPDIGEHLAPLIAAVLPLLGLTAWRPDNDALGMGARLAELQAATEESAAICLCQLCSPKSC